MDSEKIKELESRVAKLEGAVFGGGQKESVGAKSKQLSPKEFVMTKSVKTETQTLLVLAYYLESLEGIPSFNISDIDDVFRLAKIQPPKNINDAINKNIKRGFVMEAKEKKDSKKAWVLTSSGENYVEDELSK